jgi:superfamily II DNA or RNA helicase
MDLIQPKSPVLRPYQREALEASKRRLDAGVTRQLIALPTGTGKTIVFANLLRNHSIEKRMLVLVHRMELAEQAWSKLKQCNPGVRVGVEMGWRESCRADRIVIAGIQTIGRDGTGRILNFPRAEFGAIVCDEAHHAIAGTYMRVFDHFRVFDPGNRTLLLGVTATPVRGDGRGLSSVFEEIVFNMPILEAIRSGWLCDLRAFRVRTQVDLDQVRAPLNGDFAEAELDTAVNTRLRNELVVKT